MIVEDEGWAGGGRAGERADHVRPSLALGDELDHQPEVRELAGDDARNAFLAPGRHVGIERVLGGGLAGSDERAGQREPALLGDLSNDLRDVISLRRGGEAAACEAHPSANSVSTG